MDSLNAFASAKLEALGRLFLERRLTPTERVDGVFVVRDGRRLISVSCNDYLGLSHDPRVKAAAQAAVARYGAGAGASRLVTGDYPLLGELEMRLARHKGAEAALVFGSGYLANLGVIPALAGKGDLVFMDELSHACMVSGARLSGARLESFRHNDMGDLADRLGALRSGYTRTLILTEHVFSMDGDRAPLAEILALAETHDAWTLVDDAHGLGVAQAEARAPIDVGTLSKALGAYGGYVCGSAPLIQLLKSRARSLVYATGLAPAAAGAALAALDILESEPERTARPLKLAQRLTRALGLPPAQSAILPIHVGEAARAMKLSEALAARGFLAVAIRPPTVPAGQARLRITLSAAHTEAQVDALAEALIAIGATAEPSLA